jgi:hypothetical protein
MERRPCSPKQRFRNRSASLVENYSPQSRGDAEVSLSRLAAIVELLAADSQVRRLIFAVGGGIRKFRRHFSITTCQKYLRNLRIFGQKLRVCSASSRLGDNNSQARQGRKSAFPKTTHQTPKSHSDLPPFFLYSFIPSIFL